MTGRELGCRVTGCLFGTLIIFGFFASLMSMTEGLGRSTLAKKQREDAQFDMPILLGGLQTYSTTHGGRFPRFTNAAELKQLLCPQYIPTEDMFSRLGDNVPYAVNVALSNKPLASFKTPENVVVFYEPTLPQVAKKGENAKPTRGVIFLDGRLRRLDAAEWEKTRTANRLP
jgi:hypothetical protein